MDCGYADPDDILVDAIISGARELKVTERLLDKSGELTLAHTLQVGPQYERYPKNQVILFGEEDTSVSVISKQNKNILKKRLGLGVDESFGSKQRARYSVSCRVCGQTYTATV